MIKFYQLRKIFMAQTRGYNGGDALTVFQECNRMFGYYGRLKAWKKWLK